MPKKKATRKKTPARKQRSGVRSQQRPRPNTDSCPLTPDPWQSPPVALPGDALPWWEPTVTLLRERKRLKQVTPLSVWLFCQLLAQFFRATAQLNKEGQVLDIRDDKGVLKKSLPDPAFTIQSKLFDQLRRLTLELGIERKPSGQSNQNPQADRPPADDDRQAMLRRALQGFSLDECGRG